MRVNSNPDSSSPIRAEPARPGRVLHRLGSAALLMLWGLAAGAAAPAAIDPYEATVAGDAADQTHPAVFTEALRQVAVRATGRRAAATDPALAPLYANARRYVQTLKPAGPGLVTVAFDAPSVEAQLARAGEPLWERERPLTLVVFATTAPADAAQLASLRRALETTAQGRGVQLRFPTGAAPEQLGPRLASLKSGDAAPLLELGHRYGAEQVLVVTPGPSPQFAGYGRVNQVPLPATPEGALHALVDRYAQDEALAPGTGLSSVTVEVANISDARSYAAVRRLLGSLAPVRGVTLTEAERDVVRLTVELRGGSEGLRRALGSAEHLTIDSPPGVEPLRLRLNP